MPSNDSRLSDTLSLLNPLRRRTSLTKSLRSISSAFSRKSKGSAKSGDRDSVFSFHAPEDPPKEAMPVVVETPKEMPKETTEKPKAAASKRKRDKKAAKGKKAVENQSENQSYSVYEQQAISPIILRDPEATKKLLEAIIDSPNGRRAVSRLARTCKAFSKPALDVLWKELDSLTPVVGLFPSSLLKKARKPVLGLSKAPNKEDWVKIMEYGERVRRVVYDESSNAFSAAIFPYFESDRPRKYMFPNLQQLVWKTETAAGLEYCNLFLNSNLESLSLDIGCRTPKLVPLLTDVAKRISLKSLSFMSQVALPDTFEVILGQQDSLQRLVLVAPGALSPDVGRWVASLPKLKSLQLDLSRRSVIAVEGFFDEIPSSGSGASTPSSIATTDSGVFSGEEFDFSDHKKSALRLTGHLKSTETFANMRQLHLTGEAANIAVFLRYFSSPLTQLDIIIEDPPDRADWMDLSNLVCERYSESLQTLRISATSNSRFNDLVRSTSRAEPPTTARLPLDHIRPMPNLGRFEIDLPESIHFTADDVNQVAKCCPMLEELKLCPLGRFPVQTGPPKLTLEDLAPLMEQCPQLHTVSAVINAKEGSPDVLNNLKYSSGSLRRCHFGHSWIDDALHATILLSHLAPRLETVKWFHERNRPGFIENNARGWERVAENLPHIQHVRNAERRRAAEPVTIIEYVHPPVVRKADKCIGASVVTIDQGVLVRPSLAESSVQCVPVLVDEAVDVQPELTSVSIDATPQVVETEVDASVEVGHQSVDATPETVSTEVDATPSSSSKSIQVLEVERPRASNYAIIPSISNMLSFTFRILIAYPISIPMRILHIILMSPSYLLMRMRANGERRPSPSDDSAPPDTDDISMTTIQDYDYVYDNEFIPGFHSNCGTEEKGTIAKGTKVSAAVVLVEEVQIHSFNSISIMSDNKKQERDFTPEVNALLPEADSLAKAGKLQEALDKLFVLEKQTRNAADLASTTKLLKAITQHAYNVRDFTQLNNAISVLSKKHGQLKAAIQAMVEQVMGWLDDVKEKEGTERWLELVHTLREVTEGKIFLETPRARVTLLLSRYHEGQAEGKPKEEHRKSMETASELLSDLQVETYSSMERREKTEFILEQMRLLIAVARLKDDASKDSGKDSIADGESEWVKARVCGRKVNEEFLKEKDNEDLKLKYYDLMIQHALHYSWYLDVAKYYHKVWETPSIKEDVSDKGRAALEHIVYYVVLAPHDNEQSDMLHRLFIDPALEKLQLHYNLVKCFTTRELMRWPGIVQLYGEFLRQTPVFSIEKRWEDLHTRIIEHNIRVVAAYYTRITIPRLTSLLDLTRKQTEETLARLVVSKTIWARIDRPAEIITFKAPRSAEDVMNDWSSDMQKLLGLVEKTWMGMNAAQAAQSRIKAASAA
ncbi:26s proteasome non-atpase regulatory subunit 12 [Moniliophthora roreri MCA 2997]|uniref:26s proteasome non-atpase regulatory subunit 12 n=1 Tax=Moniliophthora roreri (strain MCA 2997) TaxID=1381753 RepID=V2XG17_MONRO|nr:26s proteasome non-atpase regulatory subunit 12 [Moniliophthora roreri MCA 2997]